MINNLALESKFWTLQKQYSTLIKSWAIVIFVLISHFSCQTLQHLKEKKIQTNKNKNAASCLHFDADVSHVSRVNTQGNLITVPAEFYVTFDFAV